MDGKLVLGCKYGLLVSYITLFLEFYFLSILLVGSCLPKLSGLARMVESGGDERRAFNVGKLDLEREA
jgi:hypothetical protein